MLLNSIKKRVDSNYEFLFSRFNESKNLLIFKIEEIGPPLEVATIYSNGDMHFKNQEIGLILKKEKEYCMLKSDLDDPEYSKDQSEVDRLLDSMNRLMKDPEKYFEEISEDDED